MSETIGQLKHRVDCMTNLIVKAEATLSASKATTRYAELRKVLLDMCAVIEQPVPCMHNRARTLKVAPEIIDTMRVATKALEHELLIRQELEEQEDFIEHELQDAYEVSWVLIALLIAVVLVVTLQISGAWEWITKTWWLS